MNTEEQSRSESTIPRDKDSYKDPAIQQKPLTWKQLKLVRFIAEEGVAEFEAVVQAIQNRQYKRVDEWKKEAGIRAATPPELDPSVAECLARQRARLGSQ